MHHLRARTANIIGDKQLQAGDVVACEHRLAMTLRLFVQEKLGAQRRLGSDVNGVDDQIGCLNQAFDVFSRDAVRLNGEGSVWVDLAHALLKDGRLVTTDILQPRVAWRFRFGRS